MDTITQKMLSNFPVTSPTNATGQNKFTTRNAQGTSNKGRFEFIRNLSQLFGFRRTNPNIPPSPKNLEFIKVDANSPLRIAQAKLGKTFSTKLVGKLEELFDSFLKDTSDTYKILQDRNKRILELEFAIANDPFLSAAADLYADEATQLDVQGTLIQIDCSDPRMKERMEDLLEQWGVTQNRLRSVAYNLAGYGDAFWANKVTKSGVVRINPLGIHQIKERLEFNPVQVQTDISLQKGYITAINRSAKLQALFDTMENEENEEFSDLFDTRLFGFAVDDDLVVPPWAITHFRLMADQSEFAPMGRSFFLKALNPFRMCNATMVLQSLARVMSFPVTVYNVKTAPGMDEALQFEKINQIREEYENVGDTGAGTEAYSVNTKIWAPEGLLTLDVHSPNIDISAVEDIQMYQDRVAVASGIPKGYLVQEWGGFGNSAISLVEQFKPFARRVFTVQSSILDGISNLFRLHFAITGEFDYREPFILSMKFPNEESSDLRMAAKQSSLDLSKDVLETIATVVGAVDDPLPIEVIQDILSKFSFLDQKDIKRWVKNNPNRVEHKEETPEELGGEEGGLGGGELGGGAGGAIPGGGEGMEGEGGTEENVTPGSEEAQVAEVDKEIENAPEEKKESYEQMERNILKEAINRKIKRRYQEGKDVIYEKVIKDFGKIDEATINNRHFKYSRIESCNIPMYKIFQKKEGSSDTSVPLKEEISTKPINVKKLSWEDIKNDLYESQDDDAIIDEEEIPDEKKVVPAENLAPENGDVSGEDEQHIQKIMDIIQ